MAKHQRKIQAALAKRIETSPDGQVGKLFFFKPGSQNKKKGW